MCNYCLSFCTVIILLIYCTRFIFLLLIAQGKKTTWSNYAMPIFIVIMSHSRNNEKQQQKLQNDSAFIDRCNIIKIYMMS